MDLGIRGKVVHNEYVCCPFVRRSESRQQLTEGVVEGPHRKPLSALPGRQMSAPRRRTSETAKSSAV